MEDLIEKLDFRRYFLYQEKGVKAKGPLAIIGTLFL